MNRRSEDDARRGTDRRFLSLADVAEMLNVSSTQVYTLLRSGDLPGIQIGPRKVWRIEERELDAYIDRQYAETRRKLEAGELDATTKNKA